MTISLTSRAWQPGSTGLARGTEKHTDGRIKTKQTENIVAKGSSHCSNFSNLYFKVFLILSLFIYSGR